jgi:hypothetical protein
MRLVYDRTWQIASYASLGAITLMLGACWDDSASSATNHPLPAIAAPVSHLPPAPNDSNAQAKAVAAATKVAAAKYPNQLSLTDPIATFTDMVSSRAPFSGSTKAVPMQYLKQNNEMSPQQRDAYIAQQHAGGQSSDLPPPPPPPAMHDPLPTQTRVPDKVTGDWQVMFRILKPIHDSDDAPPLSARQFMVTQDGEVTEMPALRMPIHPSTSFYMVSRETPHVLEPPPPGMGPPQGLGPPQSAYVGH